MPMKCGDPTNPGGVGIKANGDPCPNNVVPGTFRCHLHGGKAPTAKTKSETALALIRHPSIEILWTALLTLNEMLLQAQLPTCAACGYPVKDNDEKDTIVKTAFSTAKTVQMILDRTGLGPTSKLEVKQSDGDIDLQSMTLEERGEMIALLAQLKALKQRIRDRVMALPVGKVSQRELDAAARRAAAAGPEDDTVH